jgi:hypothetical protein
MNSILVPNGNNGFETDEEFFIFLKMMSMRGFYETFDYIARNRPVSYKAVRAHAARKKILKKEMLGSVLNALSNMGLVRLLDDGGPRFELTRFGEKIARGLDEAKSTFAAE